MGSSGAHQRERRRKSELRRRLASGWPELRRARTGGSIYIFFSWFLKGREGEGVLKSAMGVFLGRNGREKKRKRSSVCG